MKKIVLFAMAAAVILTIAGCDLLNKPAEASSNDAAGLVSLTIKVGGNDRALTTKLAKAGIDYYEVVFKDPTIDDTYYRTNWTKSQSGRISLPIGDYGTAEKAILFAGTAKNKTLLAIGTLTLADGDSHPLNPTVIAYDTKNIIFTMAALETDITNDGTTTSFTIVGTGNGLGPIDTSNATPLSLLPTVLERDASGKSYTVPIFLVPAGIENGDYVFAEFKWNTSDDDFDSYKDGIYVPAGLAGEGKLQAAGVVAEGYGLVDMQRLEIRPDVTSNLFNSPVFNISFETPPENGLARIFFSQPVYALFYEEGKSVKWYIQGGLNNDNLDGGYDLNSTGGSILLGVGAVNPINIGSIWLDDTYTVKYDASDADDPLSSVMANNSKFVVDLPRKLDANTLARIGYTFIGWTKVGLGETVAEYTDQQSVTNLAAHKGTVTLYPVWEANTYTINYLQGTGGDTGQTMPSETFTYDTDQALATHTFTNSDLGTNLKGYTFGGWATVDGGPVVYEPGEPVSDATAVPNGVVDLYAVWLENFIITFSAQSTSAEANKPGEQVIARTKAIIEPTLTMVNSDSTYRKTFIKWTTDSAGTNEWDFDTNTVSANETLYAQWGQPFIAGGTNGANEWNALKGLVTATTATTYDFEIDGDFTTSAGGTTDTFAGTNVTVNITATGAPRTITLGAAGNLLKTKALQTVVLGGELTLKGISSNTNAVVYLTAGTVVMKGSSEVSGNTSTGTTTGSGVYVGANATFEMKDTSKVKDNIGNTVVMNAGVYVAASGKFIMGDSSVVSGNENKQASSTGGGVFLAGNFTMKDNAEISGNKGTGGTGNSGGGVHVISGGNFLMLDNAVISGNSLNLTGNGGGVNVLSGGIFNMAGGTIYGNGAGEDAALKNTGNTGAAVKNAGTAKYGTYDGTTFTPATADSGVITSSNENQTITVLNGVITRTN